MRRWFALLAGIELLLALCACGGAQAPAQPPAAELSSSSAEKKPSAAVCMGAVSHPVHRVMQLGFLEKAEELGYEGHVLGLDRGNWQELYDCWLQGAREYDIAGAAYWVGDDSAYEFLKELHGMGVKTVVPYFPHNYEESKDFIDVNACYDNDAIEVAAADYLGRKLRSAGVQSGSVGMSVVSLNITHNDLHAFRNHFEEQYPEYTLLDLIGIGAEVDSSRQKLRGYIQANPDMVAGFGPQGGGTSAWAWAKKAADRTDIMVVGYDYTPLNLDVLVDGGVDALVALPIYDSGARSMELIDEMLHGKAFNVSEALWYQKLDAPLIYPGGAGVHDPAYYYDQYTRAEERFSQ